MIGAISPHNSLAIKRLIDEGIIPELCRSFTLVCDVNQVIVMKLEVFVTREQMDRIVAALADNPDEAKRLAREVVFTEPTSGRKAEVNI